MTIEDDGRGNVTLIGKFDGTERKIACGRNAWTKGHAGWGPMPDQPIAASGAWTEDDTFTARICFTETPFLLTLTLKADGNELRCESATNVGFGPTRYPALVGRAE